MPTKAEDTVTTEVLYPDDLTGQVLEIDPEEILEDGLAFWDAHAEEDQGDLPDDARHGHWIPVESEDNGQVWASMPRDLREAMIRHGVESGDVIEILSCEKGPGETDPWLAEMQVQEDE